MSSAPAALPRAVEKSPAEAGGTAVPLDRRGRWIAGAIVTVFVLLALAYSVVVPPFETPDELYHFGFTRHLAQGNPLPVQHANETGPWEQEGSQAPLYYQAVGLLTSRIDQSDFDTFAVRNPRANIGDPLYPGNKNFMLYSGAPQPLTGSNLALHVGRWLSVTLGVVTLLATLWLARIAFAGRPRAQALSLATMAFVAAIPQFAFLSGSLTNDALVTAVSALTVAWLALLVARPAEAPIRLWEWTILGVLLGVAALSKLQGLGLFVLAALAGLGMAWQRRSWKLPLVAALPVALPAALIAGWWYLRNIRLYGDWTGLQSLLERNGRRAGAFDLADWWLEFRGLRYSFWGLFGWFNILLPDWVYWVLDGVTVVALVGALVALIVLARRSLPPSSAEAGGRRVLLLAWAWALLSFALLVYWTIQATGSQGRLLFPALSALALLAVVGLDFWTQRAPLLLRRGLFGALIALLVGSSLYALAILLPAAYRPLPAVAALPAGVEPTTLRYATEATTGATIHLEGVELPLDRVGAGEALPVTLYWRSDGPPSADLQLFLQLLDDQGDEIANITSHPGWGRRPTSLWQGDALYPDPYELRVTGAIADDSPLRARLYVGFIDPATEASGNLPLAATDVDGAAVTPFVGAATVLPHNPPTVESLGLSPAGATLGDVVRIAGSGLSTPAVAAGGVVSATLLYEALATPATEYSAFIHLLDATGTRVAGFDQPPAATRFPTTAWRAGDRIQSTFPLALPDDLPAAEYTLWSGLYESANPALLLPVTDAAGLPSGDGRVQVGTLRVEGASGDD